jgi:isoleucyl-tRNA synthetase
MAYWPVQGDRWLDDNLNQRWVRLIDVREQALKALENARAAKVIGHSLDAKVAMKAGKSSYAWLAEYEAQLAELLIVSQVELVFEDGDGMQIDVAAVDGKKCARCWIYHSQVNEEGVCPRCAGVLKQIRAEA